MSGANTHTHVKRSHWWIVFATGVLTIICGTIGYYQLRTTGPEAKPSGFWTLLDGLYASIELLVAHSAEYNRERNWWVEGARWLGVFTFLATAWFLIVNRLRQEFMLLKLRAWRGHYVICGLTAKGMALIESIRGRDGEARIVVIDHEPDAELAQHCENLKVCVIKGDVTRPRQLKMARVTHAREILAVAPEDETNIRVAAEVRALRRSAGETRADGRVESLPRAYCRAHISNSHLPETLQKWTETGADAHTTLRFFDVFDTEARRVLVGRPLSEREADAGAAPLDGPGVQPGTGRRVHLVILGMGRMGSAIAVRAAKMGQFANGKSLCITVVDREAPRQQEELYFRYPVLAQPNEVCEMVFRQLHADSLDARRFIEQCAAEADTVLHVFVCLDSNARAVEIALRVWEIVASHPNSYVHVRITSRASVAPILQAEGARISVFGMLEDTCTVEMVLAEEMESLARAIHEEFLAARQADGSAQKRQDDPALADWEHLREDFRESNRQQADHIGIKLRAIGCRMVPAEAAGEKVTDFSAEEIEMLSQLEHRRWYAGRWLSGWRYGKETDKARRIHNCLVPWEELTEAIREYDRETVRKLPRWVEKAKLKVVRG